MDPAPGQDYRNGQAPAQDYRNPQPPAQDYRKGQPPPQDYRKGQPPPQDYRTDPPPRQGRSRHAGGRHGGRAGQPAGSAGATAPAAPSRRGPARGYPPRPGDPGPQYPQGQFAAWNEAPAAPQASIASQASTAPQASAEPPVPLMAAAPTWADITEADQLPPAGGGGVALAKRPGGFGDYALGERRGGFGDQALRERRGDDLDGYSDDEVEELAASLAEMTALVTEPPVIRDTPEYARTAETAGPGTLGAAEGFSTASRSRAAAAKERNAARRKGRKRRRVVLAGVCVPAVVAAATLAYLHHPEAKAGTKDPSSPAPSAAASAKTSPQALGRWQHIGTRAQDPAPLTLSQLFPAKFPADGTDFAQTAQLASTNCPREVFGKQLQAAVRKHSCSQVMRASYLSTKHKLMGTIGVLNLGTSADASAVGKVAGSGEFIAQLTAHSGPTHNLAKGTGLEEAEVKGHYLIMTWVEFTTLHAPKTSAQKTQLRTFSADLINQTANVSLTSRMVTGNPQVP
jgi:hypothetical protein